MTTTKHKEGLRIARLLMVMSSMSPLFILWGIKGIGIIPDRYFIAFCVIMVVVPNAFLWLRINTAKRFKEQREIVVGDSDDHRDHILVYLFAMLLPFYTTEIANYRDFAAVIAALGFVVFLFCHLNLHYMNIIFASLGYRVFTLYSCPSDNPMSGRQSQVLITHRINVSQGERIVAYRLSNTVYFEAAA